MCGAWATRSERWFEIPAPASADLVAARRVARRIGCQRSDYWGALPELNEVLNDQLKCIAQHVVVEPDGRLSLQGIRGANEDRPSGEQSHTVLLQVWRSTTPVFSTDRDSRLPPPQAEGFSDIAVNGQLWHTYVARNGDLLVRF